MEQRVDDFAEAFDYFSMPRERDMNEKTPRGWDGNNDTTIQCGEYDIWDGFNTTAATAPSIRG